MYTLAVRRTFIARHALIGGDWGPENSPNSHQYRLELRLRGPQLDEHGFLVDIVEVEDVLSRVVERYADKFLNDLPEFTGLNPSLEHFARIISDGLVSNLSLPRLASTKVVLWEDDSAWVAYTAE